MLTQNQARLKRLFDFALATLGLLLSGWLIVVTAIVVRLDTGKSGLFRQTRVGQNGKRFQILKIRTMRDLPGMTSCVTASSDPRITWLGSWLRKTKIDELPQLINVVRGEMSFVGPRPDVPEVADRLQWEAPEVLSVRPGITGPASLKYRNEEKILAGYKDPEFVNEKYIFPDKIRINSAYVRNYKLVKDFKCLWQTVSGTGSTLNILELEKYKTNDRRVA